MQGKLVELLSGRSTIYQILSAQVRADRHPGLLFSRFEPVVEPAEYQKDTVVLRAPFFLCDGE